MKEDFRISVITPVYNAEFWLKDTLECIAGQSIGMENIQSILVNDGSTDGSGEICREFADRFPDNVVYIDKKNGGVSSARNEGIKHIRGKYTVFLDSDDHWDSDAFGKIYDFFESGNGEFDVVSCKMIFSGDYTELEHPLDYKFDAGNRIVSLIDEPKTISSTIGNSVFRSDAIRNDRFTVGLSSGEDSLFVNTVLLRKLKIGILADAVFHYRRDFVASSGSSSAPGKKSWYLEVPKQYYLELEKRSIDAYGKVLPFIQYVVLYDLRWRFRDPRILTDDEKRMYLDLISTALQGIDLDILLSADKLNQFRKLYLAGLKYGKDIIKESKRDGFRYYYEGQQVLSLRARTMLFVKTFDITDGILTMEGFVPVTATGMPFRFYILDEEGTRYDPVITIDPDVDSKGLTDETIVEGVIFRTKIPVRAGRVLTFMLSIDGEEMEFRPTFDDYLGIERGQRHNYCVKSGYIIKLRKNKLSFYEDHVQTRIMSELRLAVELERKKEQGWRAERRQVRKMTNAVNYGRLRKRIAFVSVRYEGRPEGNLGMVYDATEAPKISYCSKRIQKEPDKTLEAAKVLYSSKVVVTDDYLMLLRDNKKRAGQFYVQLWHAAGAFKKFGADGTGMYKGIDSMYHRDYDLVTVSSEHVREMYASAFRIDKDKVRALGVPRTDRFFDKDYLARTRESVLEKMPELKGRQIILYAPSFRFEKGEGRIYLPDIDYRRISDSLRDDQIMVICPHPLMPAYKETRDYDKIRMVRDIKTDDMMIACDVMLTDYSSVIFDYSLLDKPMAFFCYDYDGYDRDFYLDYDKDLPGDILKSEDELISFLTKGKFEIDDRHFAFKDKFMSACDGNSSKRIAEAVTEFLDK